MNLGRTAYEEWSRGSRGPRWDTLTAQYQERWTRTAAAVVKAIREGANPIDPEGTGNG